MELYSTIFNLFQSWADVFARDCEQRDYLFFHGPGQDTWGVEIKSRRKTMLFKRTWCIEKEEGLLEISQEINAAYLGFYA